MARASFCSCRQLDQRLRRHGAQRALLRTWNAAAPHRQPAQQFAHLSMQPTAPAAWLDTMQIHLRRCRHQVAHPRLGSSAARPGRRPHSSRFVSGGVHHDACQLCTHGMSQKLIMITTSVHTCRWAADGWEAAQLGAAASRPQHWRAALPRFAAERLVNTVFNQSHAGKIADNLRCQCRQCSDADCVLGGRHATQAANHAGDRLRAARGH